MNMTNQAVTKKKLFLQTFGCQMNESDSDWVYSSLREKGYARVQAPEEADVLLINTCSVRENAEVKAYNHLHLFRRLKKDNPGLVIGVMGCMAQNLQEAILDKFPHVDIVCGPKELGGIPEFIERARDGERVLACRQDVSNFFPRQVVARQGEFRAYVKVMEGCDKFCSYCIVPFTRGREESRSVAEIVSEIGKFVEHGYQEVMLLGQNVNSYGKDFADGTDFMSLLEAVNAVPELKRIRFMTSHPHDANDRMFDAMAGLDKVCEHLHLPLQSGSDRMLPLMKRGYTLAEYTQKIARLRRRIPDISITTDLIVGFSTETEEDFQQTLRVVDELGFDSAYMFKYSVRPGTSAERTLDDDVPETVKQERFLRLKERVESGALRGHQSWVGRRVEVLIEKADERHPGRGLGRDRQFRNFVIEGGAGCVGQIVSVRVTSATAASLYGEIIV